MSNYPVIDLAIDNCVFYKRWTRPAEWAEKIRSLGVKYVEANADNELDPLFMGREYLKTWKQEVLEAEAKYGVKVANFYSGHGTYSTLGITHTDPRVRRHIIEDWFYPMLEMAGEMDRGMGFFVHGIPHAALQSEEEYQAYIDIMLEGLCDINAYAKKCGAREIGLEQMYTPHQYPWRLKDTKDVLMKVTAQSGHDFYFNEDLGHHNAKFTRPDRSALDNVKYSDVWLGSDRAYEIFKEKGAAAWDEISAEMDRHPSLFCEPEDADCYRTLRELGCYSPIVHLQQTNGRMSAHLPFTAEQNETGIIEQNI